MSSTATRSQVRRATSRRWVKSQQIKVIEKNAISHWFGLVPKKKSWRPKKTKDPDMGSYEVSRLKKVVMARPTSAIISKERGGRFQDKVAKEKRGIPPVGKYNYTKCYDHISRPMRCSRR